MDAQLPSARKRPILAEFQAVSLFFWISDAAMIMVALNGLTRRFDAGWGINYWMAALLGALIFNIYARPAGAHRSWRGQHASRFVWPVINAWVATVATLIAVAFVTKTSYEFARAVMLSWFVLVPVIILAWRYLGIRVARKAYNAGRNMKHVAVAGSVSDSTELISVIQGNPSLGLRLVGLYDDRKLDREGDASTHDEHRRGDFDDLVTAARMGIVDLVYITLPLKAENRISELIRHLSDTTASIHYVPNFLTFDLLHSRWIYLGSIPTLSIRETPFYGADGWLKALEDLLLTVVALLLSALPMAIIAIAVKLDSPGPVIFRQKRYGRDGQVISVLKFRTMRVCEDGKKITQATKDDPRVTRVGRFLRRYSLDELPQFLNVLRGEMSIVGPRPHAVAHSEEYRKLVPGYMLRHKVKPGITGLPQVSGLRGEVDTTEKIRKRVEYDMHYIREWSLWLDLKIIFLTTIRVITDKDAY